MKYLITGVGGQLGFDIKRELLSRSIDEPNIAAPHFADLDITDQQAVENYVENFRPDVVFHCAAYTNVDGAEQDIEACTKVNVDGTRYLADAAAKLDAKFIYISTDYVFDGASHSPYAVSDQVNPQSVYGQTKYQGEIAAKSCPRHFIVRTAWVFGLNGKNFVRTMLKLSETRSELTVVDDQIGSPTYTVDLAKFLVDLAESDQYGTYHATNEGFCSWAEFATEIFRAAGRNTKVIPVPTTEYLKIAAHSQAKRPQYSKLDKSSITNHGFRLLPIWQDAIMRYIKELKQEGEL